MLKVRCRHSAVTLSSQKYNMNADFQEGFRVPHCQRAALVVAWERTKLAPRPRGVNSRPSGPRAVPNERVRDRRMRWPCEHKERSSALQGWVSAGLGVFFWKSKFREGLGQRFWVDPQWRSESLVLAPFIFDFSNMWMSCSFNSCRIRSEH